MKSTIDLFNKALPALTEKDRLEFKGFNETAIRKGFLFHPNCCTKESFHWLLAQPENYNATFYKEWRDVTSKNRWELFEDQLRHYASTYGTSHTGTPYVPNDGHVVIPMGTLSHLKVIIPITAEEVGERCMNMLYSGIAMTQETIEFCVHYAPCVDVNLVKNKEAAMLLHKTLGTVPIDDVEFVRYLVYLATGKTLLIKDRATLEAISNSKLDITTLTGKVWLHELSSVFHRFKPVFLAFKKAHVKNKAIVNKLRKLADANHKPMQIGFFENILSTPALLPQLEEQLKNCNNFKKVRLLNTILIREKQFNMQFYGIRNGKLWAKNSYSKVYPHHTTVYHTVYNSLVNSLSKKKTTVRYPEGLNLCFPSSEKSFMGNYPLGTSFDLSDKNAILGIHWRESDGATDLDLSMINAHSKYGWNANYTNKDNSLVFSGDMTSADPEAVELYYAAKGFKESLILNVNTYRGEMNSKLKLFIAEEELNANDMRGHMVNPANIKFAVDCVMDSKQKQFGVIICIDGKVQFQLCQFRTGNKRVSGTEDITTSYINYALATANCRVDMRQVLIEADFTLSETAGEIDFSNLSKDTLISLMSEG